MKYQAVLGILVGLIVIAIFSYINTQAYNRGVAAGIANANLQCTQIVLSTIESTQRMQMRSKYNAELGNMGTEEAPAEEKKTEEFKF